MKRKLLSLCVIMFLFLLSGCTAVPVNVQEQANILAKNVAAVQVPQANKLSPTKGTMEQIRNQLQSDIDNNQTKITVDNARVGTGVNMPTIDVKIKGNGFDGFNDLANMLFGDICDTTNENFYRFNGKNEPLYPEYPMTDFPTDWDGDGTINRMNSYTIDILSFTPYPNTPKTNPTKSVFAYDIGNVWGSQIGYGFDISEEDMYFYYQNRPIAEKIQVSVGDLSKSYSMSDGAQWKVSDAIKFAEGFFNNEYMLAFETSPAVYEVQYVYVLQLKNGNYGYLFAFSRKNQNGNYLDSTTDPNPIGIADNTIKNNLPFYVYNQSLLWSCEIGKIMFFKKDYCFEEQNQTDSGDSLLTLGSALAILDEELASQKPLLISCAELNYAIVCKGYPYYDIWGMDKKQDCWYYSYTCYENCDFELRPVWVFKTRNYTPIDLNYGEGYYVDAITGEVTKIK